METYERYILKGCRWLVHAQMKYRGEVVAGHIIWWHGEETIKSVCGITYDLVGMSPRGSMPQFVDATSGREQIANTCVRGTKVISRLCPKCRREFASLMRGGLVVPEVVENYHPGTSQKRMG